MHARSVFLPTGIFSPYNRSACRTKQIFSAASDGKSCRGAVCPEPSGPLRPAIQYPDTSPPDIGPEMDSSGKKDLRYMSPIRLRAKGMTQAGGCRCASRSRMKAM